uniref:Zinc finger and SCAN domain-containing protein 12 n=1 Tax=Oncorhynchus kisutch TaxID=8019 RepID=A0A8C7NA65_ONCKI
EVNERTAVAEISVAVDRTVVELYEEISRSKEENNRLRRLLDLVFNPEIKLHKADPQQLTLPISEEEVLPEQQHCEQEWSPSLIQEDPVPTQIKEEQEEQQTSQEEDQLQGLFDTKDSIFTSPCVESDCDQENPSQPSHLHQTQTVEDRERDSLLTDTSIEIKLEPDVEDYRGSEPASDSQPLSAVTPDCSAAQCENMESDDEVESRGQQSGSKTLESKRKQIENGESSHTNTGGRTATMLPHLTSSSQTYSAPYCCKVATGLNQANTRGRPAADAIHPPKPPKVVRTGVTDDVRTDQIEHWPVKCETRGRCKVCQKNVTNTLCQKCDVRLCFTFERNCYKLYHMP